jgi:tRNA (mo5U34)-methyltransferase
MPAAFDRFDTVMSMGVLYHQRDPVEHLRQLRSLLATGGELILETIVVRGCEAIRVAAGQRYAGMRNVYVVPTEELVLEWLEQAGLQAVRVGPPVLVTSAEQRRTSWSPGPSLEEFLEVFTADHDAEARRTCEGHGRPWRQIFVAHSIGSPS